MEYEWTAMIDAIEDQQRKYGASSWSDVRQSADVRLPHVRRKKPAEWVLSQVKVSVALHPPGDSRVYVAFVDLLVVE